MSFKERRIESDVCSKCPARTGNMMTAQLRGSSYRGRDLKDGDKPNVDHCLVMVGDLMVADVMIINEVGDTAAANQDADFINSIFEKEISNCDRPALEITQAGLQKLCAPINTAVDKFMEVNYQT